MIDAAHPKPLLWQPAALIGALIGLVWISLTQPFAPLITADITQDRVNVVAPRPTGNVTIAQTFTSSRAGLSEVEIRFARRQDDTPDTGTISLRLTDQAGALIAQETLQTATIAHNDTHALTFAPLRDSAEKTYTLTATGTDNIAVTLWGYSLDVIANGAFSDTASPVRDLRLITRHTLAVGAALATLGRTMLQNAGLLLVIALTLPLPALLLFPRRPAPLATGIALWSLGWLWVSLVAPLPGWSLWAFVVVGWLIIGRRTLKRASSRRRTFTPPPISLMLLLAVTAATRFLAIRDLAFPAWVDSSHHALITQVMVTTQRMLTDYQPLIDLDAPVYHTGFYALPTTLILMLKSDLPRTYLILGQLFSTLIPLTTYTGAVLITRRRGVGLLAAFIVALPSFFPGFYTSWGRITQLAGMLIMPLLLGLTWRAVAPAPRLAPFPPLAPPGGRGIKPPPHRGGQRGGLRAGLTGGIWRRLSATLHKSSPTNDSLVIGILAAGLFLIHTRVFLLYVPFALVAWLGNRLRGTKTLLLAGCVAFGLALPRIVQLAQITSPAKLTHEIPNYNNFPTAYINTGWERPLLYIALLACGLAVLGWLWRLLGRANHRWHEPILALALWVGILFALLMGKQINLPIPSTWVVNINSMYITLYLPLAWTIAMAAAALWDGVRVCPRWLQAGVYALFGATLVYAGAFGVREQIDIVSTRTVLARQPDRAAIDWIAANLPDDALIANGTWQWLGSTYAAHDGSAWILPLTGRFTTTPPNDYIYGESWRRSVPAFNQAAIEIDDWRTEESADFLRDHGVTHIYVGHRGSFFLPDQLIENAAVELLYAADGAFVFRVVSVP